MLFLILLWFFFTIFFLISSLYRSERCPRLVRLRLSPDARTLVVYDTHVHDTPLRPSAEGLQVSTWCIMSFQGDIQLLYWYPIAEIKFRPSPCYFLCSLPSSCTHNWYKGKTTPVLEVQHSLCKGNRQSDLSALQFGNFLVLHWNFDFN